MIVIFSNYYKKFLAVSLFILLISFIIPLNQLSYADTKTHNVSISTGPQTIGPATIEIDYQIDFDFDRPSSALGGDTIDLTVTPKNGMLSVVVDIAGNNYSIDKDLPLGSSLDMDIAPGIEVYISTSASSIPNIEGPVDNTTKSLEWSGYNSESFQLLVSDDAKGGDEVVISLPISIDINVGLNLDLVLFKQNLGQIRLGSFDAYPVIEERIPIESVFSTEIILIPIILGAAAAGAIIYFKKIRKTGIAKQVKGSTKICTNCKASLPQQAKFCAKCGARLI